MQDFFRCNEGFEDRATRVKDKVCRSRLSDLYHKTRLQCIINYSTDILGRVVRKADARTSTLTKEQYLSVSTKH
jgi:precorrin-4 methylase